MSKHFTEIDKWEFKAEVRKFLSASFVLKSEGSYMRVSREGLSIRFKTDSGFLILSVDAEYGYISLVQTFIFEESSPLRAAHFKPSLVKSREVIGLCKVVGILELLEKFDIGTEKFRVLIEENYSAHEVAAAFSK